MVTIGWFSNLLKGSIDVPWFHGIFNAFSLSLVYLQKPFCIDFYASFSLFAGNLPKDERGSFLAKKCRRDNLQSL